MCYNGNTLTTNIKIMEQTKTSAKDFFLHLGSMIALYVVAGNFINLLFRIIDKAYPEVATYYGYYQSGSQISFPVATLIVVFPLFVFLSWTVHKTYEVSPEKKGLAIRKWLTYITLFVAGVLLAGDLVWVLYKFLDGQNLTLAFLLKAFVVVLVSGAVFGFYLQDIRDKVTAKMRKVWASALALVILASIILGFSVIGSPQTQRLLKEDDRVVTDLQNMQWQIINYWQVNGMIPENWSAVSGSYENGANYQYKKTGDLSFELCATFNRENNMMGAGNSMMSGPYYKGGTMTNDNWDHRAGLHCFSRTIDPIAYPTQVRG
jgi:hypothetical protein